MGSRPKFTRKMNTPHALLMGYGTFILQDISAAVVYLAGQVDIEMVDPVECSDACLNGVVKHLSCENRHNWRHIQIRLRISDTTAIQSHHIHTRQLELSVGRLPDPTWKHQPDRLRAKGTNSATITIKHQLQLWGGKLRSRSLESDAMVRADNHSPLWINKAAAMFLPITLPNVDRY